MIFKKKEVQTNFFFQGFSDDLFDFSEEVCVFIKVPNILPHEQTTQREFFTEECHQDKKLTEGGGSVSGHLLTVF